MKRLISLISICILSTVGFAQELIVKTDKDAIKIGEQIDVSIHLKTTRGDEVLFPVLIDTITSEIEIVSSSKIDTIETKDSLNLSQQLKITSFDSGYYAVSPLKALVNGDTILSNPFLVAVETVQLDTNQALFDIKGVAEPPFSLTEFLKEYWHLILLGLLVITGIVYAIIRFRKPAKTEVREIIKPSIPAHITALSRLDNLVSRQLWQNNKTKDYYVELTEILRWYIEARFEIYALEQTTDELMSSIKHQPSISKEQQEQIHKLLFLADLVKFAKEKPVASENEMHLKNVRAFIESHIPSVEPEKERPNDT